MRRWTMTRYRLGRKAAEAGRPNLQNSSPRLPSWPSVHAPPKNLTQPIGLFNHVRLLVNGPHVEHWLNGEKLLEYELWSDEWKSRVAASKFKTMPDYGMMTTGHIALQDDGDRVWYRNIKIRRLGDNRDATR